MRIERSDTCFSFNGRTTSTTLCHTHYLLAQCRNRTKRSEKTEGKKTVFTVEFFGVGSLVFLLKKLTATKVVFLSTPVTETCDGDRPLEPSARNELVLVFFFVEEK